MTKVLHGVLVGAVAAVAAIVLFQFGFLDRFENWTWSGRVFYLARPAPTTSDIICLEIDEYTMRWAEEKHNLLWPWDRSAYIPILDYCRKGGAKVVAFDILFPGRRDRVVDDDVAFGESIASKQDFVAALQVSPGSGRTTAWPIDFKSKQPKPDGLAAFSQTPTGRAVSMLSVSMPIPEVASNAAILGHVRESSERNRFVLHDDTFVIFGGEFIPSLGVAAYMVGNPDVKTRLTDEGLWFDDYMVPVSQAGRTPLNFRGPSQTHRTLTVASIINSFLQQAEGKQPQIPPETFKDKYVLVGLGADAVGDKWRSPMGTMIGHEFHATALDNLLNRDHIRTVSGGYVISVVIILALLFGVGVRLCQRGWQVMVLSFVGLSIPIVAAVIAYRQDIWLPIVVMEVAIILATAGAVVLNYAIEGSQKRFIKSAFSRFLSPVVIERLIENPDKLVLGGETRELSIYFSDIQGFTSISEALEPQQLTELLNQYLTAMTDIIYDEHGTVDKYEGDAIIAFWNAPLDDSDHAVHAVRAGLRCQKKLAELRPAFKELVGRDVFARIGLNTGEVVVGNMGSEQRFDYTFLGDAGNLAARLEGVNKQFGTYIMISDYTKSLLGDEFAFRELGRVKVVGRATPVTVHEPMFKEDHAAKDFLETFDKAREAYYAGDIAEALDLFETIAEDDPPAKAYTRLCRRYIDGVPKPWDGVWEMTEK